jgi:hypothetical protein
VVRTSIYRDGPTQLPPGHSLYQFTCKFRASIRAADSLVALARRRQTQTVPCNDTTVDTSQRRLKRPSTIPLDQVEDQPVR